jgi:hypothetical protein
MNPWNTDRGRAALVKIGRPVSDSYFFGACHADFAELRDLAREWLVGKGWTILCTSLRTCCYHYARHITIKRKNIDLALQAAIEATQ